MLHHDLILQKKSKKNDPLLIFTKSLIRLGAIFIFYVLNLATENLVKYPPPRSVDGVIKYLPSFYTINNTPILTTALPVDI